MKTNNKRKRINTNEYEDDVSNLKLAHQKELCNSKTFNKNDDSNYIKYMNENNPYFNGTVFNPYYNPAMAAAAAAAAFNLMPPPMSLSNSTMPPPTIIPSRLNDISNSNNYPNKSNINNTKQDNNNSKGIGNETYDQLNSSTEFYDSKNQFNGYKNKQTSTNNPYLTTLDNHLLNLRSNPSTSNIVAAKTSSYFCLTPASSTTSLHDITLIQNYPGGTKLQTGSVGVSHHGLHSHAYDRSLSASSLSSVNNLNDSTCSSISTAPSLNTTTTSTTSTTSTTTNSKKRIRTTSNIQENNQRVESANTDLTTENKPLIVRRRGRPPKNSQSSSSDQLTDAIQQQINQIVLPKEETKSGKENVYSSLRRSNSTVCNPSSAPINMARYNTIDNSTIINSNNQGPTSAKLTRVKSMINKSSSNSNLQKNKVLSQEEQKQQQLVPLNDSTNISQNKQIVNNNNKLSTVNNTINNNLIENAIEFYEKYNQSKLQKINEHLIRPYLSNKDNLIKNEQINSIVNMKSPMPSLNWANNNDLWRMMRFKDLQYRHDYNYLNRHDQIKPYMRVMLVDWMVEIAYAYRLHRETLHLSLEYLDRFMTLSEQKITVDRLQLLGLTSLFIAAKVEEIYPPKLKDFASHLEQYSKDSEEIIQEFELYMLKVLKWQISPVTSNTWLMTYLQIASINYYKFLSNDNSNDEKEHNSHIIMPLTIYKNANFNLKDYLQQSTSNLKFTTSQQQFYLNNYMRSVTLLDLCMFDMDSMRFNYSVLAASALFHMVQVPSLNPNANYYYNGSKNDYNSYQHKAHFVQLCTGFKLYELDLCIKWMYPYVETIKNVFKDEDLTHIKTYPNIDSDDAHNIQLYHQNEVLFKDAQTRKTPCKFNNSDSPILTPPNSNRKNS